MPRIASKKSKRERTRPVFVQFFSDERPLVEEEAARDRRASLADTVRILALEAVEFRRRQRSAA